MRAGLLILLVLGWMGFGGAWQVRPGSDPPLPSAEDVLHDLVAQAGKVGKGTQNDYSCTKETVTEDLDRAGRVAKREVHINQSHSDLGGISDAYKWSSENGFGLDDDLLKRYTFTVVKRVVLHDRPTLLLTFRPKDPPPPPQHSQDYLLNQVVGTLWVDEQDHELARADLCLGKAVSFGILGAVDVLTFSFERFRGDHGHWMTRWTDTFIKARKFILPVRRHRHVDWMDFKKAPTAR